MIFGLPPFTFVHTLISLIGIATGLYVLFLGYLADKHLAGWTNWFLWSTALTSITGFPLPAKEFMPSHAVGILSLAQLFAKVPALKEMAPTQTEPPFQVAQGVFLVIFIVLGVLAMRRFKTAGPGASAAG